MTHQTKTSKFGLIAASLYLLIAILLIGGELHARIYNAGNSEFAGMLSLAWTLPTGILFAWIFNTAFGVQFGDDNVSFVLILGFAAIINAVILYFIGARVSRLFSSAPK